MYLITFFWIKIQNRINKAFSDKVNLKKLEKYWKLILLGLNGCNQLDMKILLNNSMQVKNDKNDLST